MKFSNSILLSVLLSSALVSIANIQADTNVTETAATIEQTADTTATDKSAKQVQPKKAPASMPQLSKEQKVMIDHVLTNLLGQVLQQTRKVDMVLEELALMVSSSSGIKPESKSKLVGAVRDMRAIIEQVQKNTFLNVDIFSLYALINFNRAIMDHLEIELPKGFDGFQPFDLSKLQLRNPGQDLDLEVVVQLMQDNETQLVNISKKAKTIGINRFNKAYRTFDKWIIQPVNKYSLVKRAFLATALVGGLIFLAHHSNVGLPSDEDIEDGLKAIKKAKEAKDATAEAAAIEALKNKAGNWKWLRNLVGYMRLDHDDAAEMRHAGKSGNDEVGNYHKFRKLYPVWMGNLTSTLRKFGQNPVIMWGVPAILPMYKAQLSYAWQRVREKVYKFHNWARGGAFGQQTVMTLENKLDPKVTFDDLVGLEHVKKELSVLVSYMADPESFDRSKRTPQKGFLLLGPTRTGKSFSAKALSGELFRVIKQQGRQKDTFGFYEIPASLILDKGITYWLGLAKKEAPCVLFVDEIDMLGLQRAGGSKETLAEFLTAMSGTLESEPDKQVIILAATNRPENIDESLRQRGRFGTEIRFEYPGVGDRRTYIMRKLKGLGVNINNFDVEQLALETEGSSYEDLHYMVTEGINKAKLDGSILSQRYLEASLNETIRRIEMIHGKEIPAHEQQILAAHQAGHALATVLLSDVKHLGLVTTRPVKPKFKEESAWSQMEKKADQKQPSFVYGGMFTYHKQDTINLMGRQERINQCKIELAGHIAEHILLGNSGCTFHGDDKERAFNIAINMLAGGIDVRHIPNEMACKNKYFEQAFELIEQYEKEVMELLMKHKDTLAVVAQELQQRKDLTGKQVKSILDNGALIDQDKINTAIRNAMPQGVANAHDMAQAGLQEKPAAAAAA